MATHSAIVSPAAGAPLRLVQIPNPTLSATQVRVRNTWIASATFDLHQTEGGLAATDPNVIGLNAAGTVSEIGSEVQNVAVGDEVFYFGYSNPYEKTYQEFSVVEEYRIGKRPLDIPAAAAATVPDNFVTTFHALTNDLRLDLPWPIPNGFVPTHAESPILIWGGSSSVGQYALQVLRHYGYRNLWATASAKQHEYLKTLGARHVFDYRNGNVVDAIQETLRTETASAVGPAIPFIFDCITSVTGSLPIIAQLAQKSSRVAALLPVVLKSPGPDRTPEYSQDVQGAVSWADGVEVTGTRTFLYTELNEFLKKHLQPTIMPALLQQGIVVPNRYRVVQGDDALQRAQNALDELKSGLVSGERLVWEY